MINFINECYDSDDNILNEVLLPSFDKGKHIDIVSAYFGIEAFDLFYDEITAYSKDNKIRLIIGADSGYESQFVLHTLSSSNYGEVIEHLANNFFEKIVNVKDDTLLLLHKFLMENILEIKVGFDNENNLFHSKFYLFSDYINNFISINGSVNFTYSGLVRNYEQITVRNDNNFYFQMKQKFEKLWTNSSEKVTTKYIQECFINKIEKEFENRNINTTKPDEKVQLRDYQKEAINGLLDNNFNGLLNMATGTGKTFTSISALNAFLNTNNEKNYLVNIVVPYKHLISQWEESLKKIIGNDISILKCHSENNNWKNIFSYYIDSLDTDNVFILMVDNTFKKNFDNLKEYYKVNNSILMVDEAHNFGNNVYEMLMNEYIFNHKIALTATPNHYLDEKRTENLYKYFGKYEFVYDLKDAIKYGHLTKYNYYIHIVSLDADEEKKYKRLTRLIKEEKNNLIKQNYLEERSQILSTSRQKLEKLQDIIKYKEDISNSLIYCSSGKVGIDNQYDYTHLEQTSKLINDIKNDVISQKITYSENINERTKIVESFTKGYTQIILAIRCLDEGYDIPAIKDAYILSSTQNPKEYVQRRGRILRKFEGKEISSITDFIVEIDGEIVEEDHLRFTEYSSLAENKEEVNEKIKLYNWR